MASTIMLSNTMRSPRSLGRPLGLRMLVVSMLVCLLVVNFPSAHGLNESETQLERRVQQQQLPMQEDGVCPIYRSYDSSDPTAVQFNAPHGCKCVDGMEDLYCAYCLDDAPCKDVNSSHYCRPGMIYAPGDTYKSYHCDLAGTLSSFFTGGKISVYANISAKTIDVAIWNLPTINYIHAVDCNLTGCEFPMGGANVKCELAVCNCTDYCGTFAKGVVASISGQPAEMLAEELENGAAFLSIEIENAMFPFEAVCNTSACTMDPNDAVNETLAEIQHDLERTWTETSTFAVIVLGLLFGMSLLLSLCMCLPFLNTSGKQPIPGTQQPQPESFNSSVTDNQQHVLEFRHIGRVVQLTSRAAKKAHGSRDKTILHNISGSVQSGTLLGIMGPSGAGKSSLLNILAAVDDGKAQNSGQILLDGKLCKRGYRDRVAYVQQDDTLYGTLSVRECVEYSALLRLPRTMSYLDKQVQVDQTLEELRLTDIATNRIGTGGANAGVSGGERKRVSIGMELVARPAVIFLDEPSSGLDSHAANQIMRVLHDLASRNRIVILSIHQPSMKAFLAMDQILVLGGGRVMYNGKPAQVGQYLEEHGFPCPELETMADHLLDVVSDKAKRGVLTGPSVHNSDMDRLVNGEYKDQSETAEDPIARQPIPQRASFVTEFAVLLGRTSKDIFRNRELFLMQLFLSTILACFGGAIFNDVPNNLSGFQNRMGAFYFSLSFFAFASFSSMDIFVKERHIFVRETGSKYHRAFSYFLAKTVWDMFALRIIPVTVFVFIFYWLMGLRNEPEAFIIFWATLVLFNVCAGVMSICISISTKTVGQANLIASVWFLIMLLFGGFLVNVQTMDPWYGWLKYVSIFYYSFELLMTNELTGLLLSFDAPGYPALPVYGEVFLATIGMNVDNQLRDLICLCSLAVGFSVLAYLLLLLRVPISAGKHFQRMQNENKNLSRKMSALADVEKEEEEEGNDRMGSPTPNVNATNLHSGNGSPTRSTRRTRATSADVSV